MKGLLLKDFYAIQSELRAFLVLDAILILAARFSSETSFMLYYPCILSGLIAMTLISYEENAKWHIYALTLPYSRAQLVASKYIIGLAMSGLTIAATCLVQLTRPDGWAGIPGILFTMVPMALLPTALLLPFIFKLGSEKGRMAYYLVLGGFCGIAALLNTSSAMTGRDSIALIQEASLGIPAVLTSVLLYGLSWWLSTRFYEKREF